MIYPSTEAMCVLLAIGGRRESLFVRDGELLVTLPRRDGTRADEPAIEHYEELLRRGWITDDEPPRITKYGRAAVAGWMRREFGVDAVPKSARLKRATTEGL